MTLKSTLFAGVLAARLAAPAFANDAPVAAPPPQFSAADTQILFEQDAKPMQLAALSPQEMKATEGAWGFASVFGAGVGMYTYGLSCSSCSVRGFAAAGAFGAFAPVSSVTRFYGSMGLATAYGVGSRRGWW